MRRISRALVLGACVVPRIAHADLPNTAPIYGSDSLDAIGAALEHSASAPRQNDSHEHDEAERRLRANGDALSMAMGSAATSAGATMLIGGIALASQSNFDATTCVHCLSSAILMLGGFQLTLLGIFNLGEYGGPHRGKHHQRRVDELANAMSHASMESSNAARRSRLTLAWSFLASGLALGASSVALFAMGHTYGFDDDAREALAAVNALVGGWLLTIGTGELASKWTTELAFAPTRGGGAMLTYERRW